MKVAYKLLKVRKAGTLGPLFINRRQIIPLNVWLRAENHPTPGYAVRPGWHVMGEPKAPHLSMKGRKWMKVEIKDYKALRRPKTQGGTWWLAEWIKVLKDV